MKIITNNKGKAIGKISVLRTIATMQPGEKWHIAAGEAPLNSVQVSCSRYARISGKQYHVSSPAALEGAIIITRIQ